MGFGMVDRIIDSHQHFWQVGRFDYPWMSSEVEVLYRDYMPEMLEPILQRRGVSKTVLVQASNSVEETRWLLELADRNQFIGGVVGWVDLTSSEVSHQLAEFTKHPKFKGIRHLVESEPDDDWLVQPDVLHGFAVLASFGLTFDMLVHTRHLKHVKTVVQRCPELKIVIDHMAKPPISLGQLDEWSKGIAGVAAFPNVHCKLSGLVTEATWSSWKTDDLRPFVEYALSVFGPSRMMFGSDHPVCLLAASYDRVLESFQSILAELPADDRSRIFATNAEHFYKLEEDQGKQ
jgi:L-fuconolactonase